MTVERKGGVDVPTKLTAASARKIRVSGDVMDNADLAHQYGISERQIERLHTGQPDKAEPHDLSYLDDEEDVRFADWHTGGPR